MRPIRASSCDPTANIRLTSWRISRHSWLSTLSSERARQTWLRTRDRENYSSPFASRFAALHTARRDVPRERKGESGSLSRFTRSNPGKSPLLRGQRGARYSALAILLFSLFLLCPALALRPGDPRSPLGASLAPLPAAGFLRGTRLRPVSRGTGQIAGSIRGVCSKLSLWQMENRTRPTQKE